MKGSISLYPRTGDTNIPPLPDDISRAQKNRIINGYNKITDHLTEKDIEGAIKDIIGEPIMKDEKTPYQHYKEVEEAINGLKKDRDSLEKSIRNPNLPPEVEKSIKDAINEFDIHINNWNKIKEEYHK